MNTDRREKIVKDNPNLYKYPIYFECEDGWLDIIEELSKKLEDLIIELKSKDSKSCVSCWATQVKEKYGTLHFYLATETDKMSALIAQAEQKSSKTCEICGKQGELNNRNHWYSTLCKEHIN